MEKDEVKKKFNFEMLLKYKMAFIIIAIVLIVILVLTSLYSNKKTKTIVTSTLTDISEIEELRTIRYTHNGIAIKYKDEEKKKPEYYVKYEGYIKAGIGDLSKSEIKVTNNKIYIKLPEAKILQYNVDPGTFKYIYESNYKENAISSEAYKIARIDLLEEVRKKDEILENAHKNAVSIIENLIKPLVGDEYEIVIE